METEPRHIQTLLPEIFLEALRVNDQAEIDDFLSSLKDKESFLSDWAVSLGIRLQIRDALLLEKGALASLHEKTDGDIPELLRPHIATFDQTIDAICGFDKQHNTRKTPEELRAQRLDRLISESMPNKTAMLLGFSTQTTRRFMHPDRLLDRMQSLRGGIVESLWEAAMTYNEVDVTTAQSEFDQKLVTLNDDLDSYLQGVVNWEN